MIDNFAQLIPFLKWEKNTFYKFMVIQRAKDVEDPALILKKDRRECVVKQWFITNEADFLKYKEDMIKIADALYGRIYFTVDKKDMIKSMFRIQNKLSEQLQNGFAQLMNSSDIEPFSPQILNKLVASSTSEQETTAHGCKFLLVDIDVKDSSMLRDALSMFTLALANPSNLDFAVTPVINSLDITILPTVNGYHLLVPKKFRLSPEGKGTLAKWLDVNSELVEIKNNALGLAYANI